MPTTHVCNAFLFLKKSLIIEEPDMIEHYLTPISTFFLKDSAGVLHLKKLSVAGLTHVHLLPTFQFAGVDDIKDNWKHVGKHISYLIHL